MISTMAPPTTTPLATATTASTRHGPDIYKGIILTSVVRFVSIHSSQSPCLSLLAFLCIHVSYPIANCSCFAIHEYRSTHLQPTKNGHKNVPASVEEKMDFVYLIHLKCTHSWKCCLIGIQTNETAEQKKKAKKQTNKRTWQKRAHAFIYYVMLEKRHNWVRTVRVTSYLNW